MEARRAASGALILGAFAFALSYATAVAWAVPDLFHDPTDASSVLTITVVPWLMAAIYSGLVAVLGRPSPRHVVAGLAVVHVPYLVTLTHHLAG